MAAESRVEKIESSSEEGDAGSDPCVEFEADEGAEEIEANSFVPDISASWDFTGSKSTKTKSLGMPGLFLGRLEGGRLVR